MVMMLTFGLSANCFAQAKTLVKAVASATKPIAETFGLEGEIERWKNTRDDIHADVCAHAFDPELGCFVRSYGDKEPIRTLI